MSGRICAASWAGTGLLAMTSMAAVVTRQARPAAAAVALGLNGAGVVIFFWAYAVAVRRSRSEAIGIGGLFFLAGRVAPRGVRHCLLAALLAQVVIGIATAAARPYTSLAFGVLAPLYGLSLTGLWAARHGRFDPRAATAAGQGCH